MVDRILRAFDVLKAQPMPGGDTPQKKKDRLMACTQLSDLITMVPLR